MAATDATQTEFDIPGELQGLEREAFEHALDSSNVSTDDEFEVFKETWMVARGIYGSDNNGLSIDLVHSSLERIVVVSDEANKPLHRNQMRVDWADSLGAGERRYVMSLRGTLTEVSRLATEAIDQGKNSCLCLRDPGTNPSCPLHQLEQSD